MNEYTHAGIAIQAADTGRVLMIQRAWDETDKPEVRGTWEFPGGSIDPGETPEQGAWREFHEETGLPRPRGSHMPTATWTSGGCYIGHLYVVATEADAFTEINPDRDAAITVNPDDPERTNPDVTAWFTLGQIRGLGNALRPEVLTGTHWSLFTLDPTAVPSTVSKAVDGDGDGKIFDGTPYERPAPPQGFSLDSKFGGLDLPTSQQRFGRAVRQKRATEFRTKGTLGSDLNAWAAAISNAATGKKEREFRNLLDGVDRDFAKGNISEDTKWSVYAIAANIHRGVPEWNGEKNSKGNGPDLNGDGKADKGAAVETPGSTPMAGMETGTPNLTAPNAQPKNNNLPTGDLDGDGKSDALDRGKSSKTGQQAQATQPTARPGADAVEAPASPDAEQTPQTATPEQSEPVKTETVLDAAREAAQADIIVTDDEVARWREASRADAEQAISDHVGTRGGAPGMSVDTDPIGKPGVRDLFNAAKDIAREARETRAERKEYASEARTLLNRRDYRPQGKFGADDVAFLEEAVREAERRLSERSARGVGNKVFKAEQVRIKQQIRDFNEELRRVKKLSGQRDKKDTVAGELDIAIGTFELTNGYAAFDSTDNADIPALPKKLAGASTVYAGRQIEFPDDFTKAIYNARKEKQRGIEDGPFRDWLAVNFPSMDDAKVDEYGDVLALHIRDRAVKSDGSKENGDTSIKPDAMAVPEDFTAETDASRERKESEAAAEAEAEAKRQADETDKAERKATTKATGETRLATARENLGAAQDKRQQANKTAKANRKNAKKVTQSRVEGEQAKTARTNAATVNDAKVADGKAKGEQAKTARTNAATVNDRNKAEAEVDRKDASTEADIDRKDASATATTARQDASAKARQDLAERKAAVKEQRKELTAALKKVEQMQKELERLMAEIQGGGK